MTRPHVTHFTYSEGGVWYNFPVLIGDRKTEPVNLAIHALKFSDNSIWDIYNGWTPTKEDPEIWRYYEPGKKGKVNWSKFLAHVQDHMSPETLHRYLNQCTEPVRPGLVEPTTEPNKPQASESPSLTAGMLFTQLEDILLELHSFCKKSHGLFNLSLSGVSEQSSFSFQANTRPSAAAATGLAHEPSLKDQHRKP